MDHPDAPDPFKSDRPSSCKRAWTGGTTWAPEWRYLRPAHAVDLAGFHVLVRAAGLPLSELVHMGFTAPALSADAFWLPAERAERLLGRIAWDAVYAAQQGAVWRDQASERALALHMGRAVVRAWFS